jgi:hypothetical protein
MKQQDIATLAVVVIVSGVFSFMLTSLVLLPKNKRELTVQKVDPITSNFPEADKKVFNEQAINPTKLIQIGDNSNSTPF